MKRRGLRVAAACLVLAACEDEDARVVFTIFPEESRLEGDMLTVRFDDGAGSRTVRGEDDFVGGAGRMDSREFSTRTRGTLWVEYELVDGTDPISEGSVEIPLREDWTWGVQFFLTDQDPARMCFGCFGSAGFPVDPARQRSDADSLWVVWGGNSISNPVVY